MTAAIPSLPPKRGRGRPRKVVDSRAEINIKWIEEWCRVPDGRRDLIGKPVVLREWQRAAIRTIYDNPHGTRRAILSFGRKNGKTAFAAMLMLLHLCGPEAQVNSQLFSAAQARAQAALLFEAAAKIVRMNPQLDINKDGFISINDTNKVMRCLELGTVYRALSAEVTTAFGLSPSFIVHDELGQVRGPRSALYQALETATGAQEKPLSIVISTQAPTDGDLLSLLIDDARSGHDPSTVLVLHTAPLEADPFADETIKMANPAYGDFLNAAEVRSMADAARRMPSAEADYRNLILNQRVATQQAFVPVSVWDECAAVPMPLDELEVYGGLDLSAVSDLTALVLIGKHDSVWHVHPTFWLPGHGLREKSQEDRQPYDLWARDGHLITAAGKSVDYEEVALYLREVFDRYKIMQIGFDDWAFTQFQPWLLKAGFSESEITAHFVNFRQGSKSMTPALRVLESELKNARIAHGNHPVLRMCAMNAVTHGNDNARKLVKPHERGRIDGMVALAMAMGVVPTPVGDMIDVDAMIV
jgi:phage terminase large subunit-like protein